MLTIGDCRAWARTLEPESVQTIVTSPPYFGLRSYLPPDHPDKARELGAERTPDEYVANLVALFRDLRAALRDDGTCWINLGDSYAANRSYQVSDSKHPNHDFGESNATRVPPGLKSKDLIGIPWSVAFALRADGWYLRSDIVWAKRNCMPESVRDRPTRSHEFIFLLSKRPTYYYDADAIREGDEVYTRKASKPHQWAEFNATAAAFDRDITTVGRNKRDVWTVATTPYPEAHFATFPPELIRPCILAGSRRGDTVCDPFMGSGTTAAVAEEEGRRWVGCDLDPRATDWLAGRLAKVQRRLAV